MSEVKQTIPPPHYHDEVDMREIVQILWIRKWLIASVTIASIAVATAIALYLPNIYQAETLLAPNQREEWDGLSGLAAQYGGLASLAGIDLKQAKNDKTALALEVLKSKKFVSEFIGRRDLLVPLLAAKRWNSKSGELIIDSDEFDTETGKWVRKVRPPRQVIPTSQEAYREFMKLLYVNQDRRSGFVSVAISHYSPEIAKQWTEWLIEDLNSTMMHQDVAEAEIAIAYLKEQITNTSLAGLQTVFFGLIEEQTKTIMLAKVSPEYIFKMIDPPIAPERKAEPNRIFIVAIGLLAGLFGGTLLSVVTRSSFSEKGDK